MGHQSQFESHLSHYFLAKKFKMLRFMAFCALMALASAAPQKVWPAGVSPAACPNYPDCSTNIDPTSGIPYTAAGVPAAAPALQWPAGVSPAACPNFPNCDANIAPTSGFVRSVVQVPVGYVNTAGYPAGLSAASCPNYPFCF